MKSSLYCITLFRLVHSLLLWNQSLCNLIRKAFSAIIFISLVHLAPLSYAGKMSVLDTAVRTNHNEWQLLCDYSGCVVEGFVQRSCVHNINVHVRSLNLTP